MGLRRTLVRGTVASGTPASRRRLVALVAVLATSLGVVALPARDARAVAAPDAGLRWRACHDGLQCTEVRRPAHLDDPTGPTIELAVARIPAGDPEARVGVLVVNPGGPGLSPIGELAGLRAALPNEVQDRFDVVTFDPRGVGATTPVDCDASLDPVFDLTFSPVTPAAHDALVAAFQRVATACASHNGALLDEVSTVVAARDMDAVRAALGERQLSYVGFSYGTYLGALYAAQHPERVRALVLDGAIDPTVDAAGDTLLQAVGFEQNLDGFLAWCSDHRDCKLARGDRDAAHAYDALRRRLAVAPLAARDGEARALNDTRFDAAVLQLLYGGRASWPALADGLAAADAGDAEPLLRVADRFLGRRSGGGDDGSLDAFWAVSCLDDPTFGDVTHAADTQDRASRVAPRLGAFIANFSLACSVWPTRVSSPASGASPASGTSPASGASPPAEASPSITGAAPDALVVGGTDDPATPLVSAKRLARTLGGASLVVVPTDQHTAIGSGNACVDDAVAAYLVAPRSHPATRRC